MLDCLRSGLGTRGSWLWGLHKGLGLGVRGSVLGPRNLGLTIRGSRPGTKESGLLPLSLTP
jgi:hypothetical protein